MLYFYGHYKYVYFYSTRLDYRRENLTSKVDPRAVRVNVIIELVPWASIKEQKKFFVEIYPVVAQIWIPTWSLSWIPSPISSGRDPQIQNTRIFSGNDWSCRCRKRNQLNRLTLLHMTLTYSHLNHCLR